MKRFIITSFVCLYLALLQAGEWQWSVSVKGCVSVETGMAQEVFLWIPPACERVKAVMVGQQNMSEEILFELPSFRRSMEELGIALLWIAPELSQSWDVSTGIQQVFDTALTDLAETSGYTELSRVPVIPIGHSAQATFPWNFAAWNPERTLAIISLHGDAPRTNLTGYGRANLEWGRTRNIDGIPGLMIEGEYEWWESRVRPALAFRMMYPLSCISFLCDTGRGHFDVAERTADYIALFLKKTIEQRLLETDGGELIKLKKVNPQEGWLAERWLRGDNVEGETRLPAPAQSPRRSRPAPFVQYKGDPHDAFWYFDREMAELTEDIYRQERGKQPQYLSFLQEGELVPYHEKAHLRITAPFRPEADGLTFHLKAVYTDSTYRRLTDVHAAQSPVITRVCGPVKQVNDTTFRVSFYRIGMFNKRRSGGITLLAASLGDKRYKGAVQELSLTIPYRHTAGKRQHLLFPGLSDVSVGTESLSLKAVSDCGLPVSYYVKAGPAEVKGNNLVFTRIPPRSKFPIKVTVVAWQYGLSDSVQTAEPVERSFYIRR